MNSLHYTTLCVVLANVPHKTAHSPKMALRLVNRAFNAAVCDDDSWSEKDRFEVDDNLKWRAVEGCATAFIGDFILHLNPKLSFIHKVIITSYHERVNSLLDKFCGVYIDHERGEEAIAKANVFRAKMLGVCSEIDKLTGGTRHVDEATAITRRAIYIIEDPTSVYNFLNKPR